MTGGGDPVRGPSGPGKCTAIGLFCPVREVGAGAGRSGVSPLFPGRPFFSENGMVFLSALFCRALVRVSGRRAVEAIFVAPLGLFSVVHGSCWSV